MEPDGPGRRPQIPPSRIHNFLELEYSRNGYASLSTDRRAEVTDRYVWAWREPLAIPLRERSSSARHPGSIPCSTRRSEDSGLQVRGNCRFGPRPIAFRNESRRSVPRRAHRYLQPGHECGASRTLWSAVQSCHRGSVALRVRLPRWQLSPSKILNPVPTEMPESASTTPVAPYRFPINRHFCRKAVQDRKDSRHPGTLHVSRPERGEGSRISVCPECWAVSAFPRVGGARLALVAIQESSLPPTSSRRGDTTVAIHRQKCRDPRVWRAVATPWWTAPGRLR